MGIEELENQVSFMVEKFQSTIKSIEDVKPALDKTSDSIRDIFEKITDIYNRLNHVAQKAANTESELSDHKKQTAIDKSDIEMQVGVVSLQADDLKQIVETPNPIEEIAQHFENKIKSITSTFTRFVNFDDVKRLYIEIEEIKKLIDLSRKEFLDCQSKANDAVADMRSEVSAIPGIVQSMQASVDSHDKQLSSIQSEMSNIRLENKSLPENLMGKVKDLIDEKISSIETPDVPSNQDTKQLISSVVEPISLDAKNAYARSMNNETRVMMLEKKLESLNLLINKLNLG